MMRINDIHAIKLTMEAARVQFVPSIHFCIAEYDDNDCLRGSVLYTDFWGGSCMMHVAGFKKGWGTKSLLWIAFDYPFRMIKVKKVFSTVPEWNWRSRHFALHIGFRIECLLNDVFTGFPNELNGMYVMSMREEDCKWLTIPRPNITFAPQEHTNVINQPLAVMQPVGTA